MPIKHLEEYRDPDISKALIESIKMNSDKPVRLMEVCGTHTVSIFRNGIRSVLPNTISLLSGPGCPVCVTAQNEINAFIELSKINNVIDQGNTWLYDLDGDKIQIKHITRIRPLR